MPLSQAQTKVRKISGVIRNGYQPIGTGLDRFGIPFGYL